jgi:hypothetical protein
VDQFAGRRSTTFSSSQLPLRRYALRPPNCFVMNPRQLLLAQSLVRAAEFAQSRLDDFTHEPATKVDLKFRAAVERLGSAITALGGSGDILSGAAAGKKSGPKELRRELRQDLRRTYKGAAAISAEKADSALLERFALSEKDEGDILVTARTLVQAIRELDLNDEFEGLGYGEDLASKLEAAVTAIEVGEGSRPAGPSPLDDGKVALRTLGVIMENVYAGNAELLATWLNLANPDRPLKKDKPAAEAAAPTV